jgi:hypothetical protein
MENPKMKLEDHRRQNGTIDLLSAAKALVYENEEKSDASYIEKIWGRAECNFKKYFDMIEEIHPIKSRQVASAIIATAFEFSTRTWINSDDIVFTEKLEYKGNGYWGLPQY